MKFEIVIDSGALADLQGLRAYDRKTVLDLIERVLTTTPAQISKSRMKRLRGLDSPQYRLRLGTFRVFHDIVENEVYVMRVFGKAAVAKYLKEMGYEIEDHQRGGTGPGDGGDSE